MSSQVPIMLGMNVISRCYRELFGQHGLALFDLPVISGAPKSVVQALHKCHQASEKALQAASGKVRVRGECLPYPWWHSKDSGYSNGIACPSDSAMPQAHSRD